MTRPSSTAVYAGDEPILTREDCLRIMSGELTRDQIANLLVHRRRLASVTLNDVAEIYIKDFALRDSDHASAPICKTIRGRVYVTGELRFLDWISALFGDFPVLVADDGDFQELLSRTRWPHGMREAGRIVLHRIVQHYNAKRESTSPQSR